MVWGATTKILGEFGPSSSQTCLKKALDGADGKRDASRCVDASEVGFEGVELGLERDVLAVEVHGLGEGGAAGQVADVAVNSNSSAWSKSAHTDVSRTTRTTKSSVEIPGRSGRLSRDFCQGISCGHHFTARFP